MSSIPNLVIGIKKQKERQDLSRLDRANIGSVISQLDIVNSAILSAERGNYSSSTPGYTITWEGNRIVRVSAHNPSNRNGEGMFYKLYNSRLDDYLIQHLEGYIGREKQPIIKSIERIVGFPLSASRPSH